MAESKYFPDLTNGVDVADVEQIKNEYLERLHGMNRGAFLFKYALAYLLRGLSCSA